MIPVPFMGTDDYHADASCIRAHDSHHDLEEVQEPALVMKLLCRCSAEVSMRAWVAGGGHVGRRLYRQ